MKRKKLEYDLKFDWIKIKPTGAPEAIADTDEEEVLDYKQKLKELFK